ncbi:MAG TPA: HipA family kinase [Candidatus Angelobacter sp.]|nr:HipA family kinase [Candidatus Angelobacter sp.]
MTASILSAVQQIRRMRGGSQSHLMRASDGNFYITKFQGNPQHTRVLANEFLASKLGLLLGLPMPEVVVIEVSDWLIGNSPDLYVENAGHNMPCSSGLQLGSRYVVNPEKEMVFDYLPESLMQKNIRNLQDFARVLVLDKWTGNADGRQVIFSKSAKARKYSATFIDQGYCFNAGEWNFPDSPLRGIYARNCVYECVTGWESFEPVLSRAEQMDYNQLCSVACDLPEDWWLRYGSADALSCLFDLLYQRRSGIRDLITAFRNSSRNPFPNWKS